MDKLWEHMHGYSFDALKAAVNEIAANGYPMSAIISQLHDEVISKTDLQDVDKALIAEKIAEVSLYFSLKKKEKKRCSIIVLLV